MLENMLKYAKIRVPLDAADWNNGVRRTKKEKSLWIITSCENKWNGWLGVSRWWHNNIEHNEGTVADSNVYARAFGALTQKSWLKVNCIIYYCYYYYHNNNNRIIINGIA